MSKSFTPADQPARDHIVGRLGQRTVVVAGAGSGKTSVLVSRVSNELQAGLDPHQLVVITFTEKAARELVHRLRDEIPASIAIDEAYIGTIHGFCARILRNYPIEAGLPPMFQAIDEIAAGTAEIESAKGVVRELYDRSIDDPSLAEAVAALAEAGRLNDLHALAITLARQWDSLESAESTHRSRDLAAELLAIPATAMINQVVADSRVHGSDDQLAVWLTSTMQALRVGFGGSLADAWRPVEKPNRPGRFGLGATWAAWGHDKPTVRQAANEMLDEARALVADEIVRRLLQAMVPRVLEAAAHRRRRGELNFDDLLVLTRRLVAHNRQVRDELQDTYRQIYVDEFQDTDPVQFETIDLLCRPEDTGHAVLFAVGDPKQAIYGFRGARPELFQDLARQSSDDGTRFDLATNFRSRDSVTAWINTVIGARFGGAGHGVQTPYQDLAPARRTPPGDPGVAVTLLGVDGAGDALVPVELPTAFEAVRQEATDIAAAIGRVRSEGWLVTEQQRPATWRDITVLVRTRGVLAPLEASLQAAGIPYRVEGGTLVYETREIYELLRVARAVEFITDAKSVVTALRTSVMGVSDLELFRFHEVFRYWSVPSEATIATRAPDGVPADVQVTLDALAMLRRWNRRKHSVSPAALLAEIYDETLGATSARLENPEQAPDVWRRIRFVIDEARAWSDSTGGTLSDYLAWVALRVERLDRADIATDELDDAVRVMTIHAAKGLEFPVVVLAALGRGDANPPYISARVHNGRVEARLADIASRFARDDEYKTAEHAEEARLLYVGATRAEDHLIVALHRAAKASKSAAARLEPWLGDGAGASLVAPAAPTAMAAPDDDLEALYGTAADPDLMPVLTRPSSTDRRIWTPSGLAEHFSGPAQLSGELPLDAGESSYPEHLIAVRPGREPIDGAPGEARVDDDDRPIRLRPADAGLRKDGADGRLVERSRGRYGTSIGVAVHAVLQHVDLDAPTARLDEVVARCCAEADVTQRGEVAQLARSIISSPLFETFRTAARRRREIYVGTTLGEGAQQRVLWGYVDAAYEAADGSLVVIDFKTDSRLVSGDELAERYRLQMSGYAAAVGRATGRHVSAAYLLVGRRSGEPALEVPVDLVDADSLAELLATAPDTGSPSAPGSRSGGLPDES